MTSPSSFAAWPGWARGTAYAAVLLVLTLVAGLVTVVVLVRRPLPQVEGTLRVPGLTGRVEVLRDGRGIAQVYADTSADLFLAQGYVTAQDRFLEMDHRRHVSSGRLSELIGSEGLRSDMTARTMGWRRVAAVEYDLLSEEAQGYLQAYSEGVNAYLDGRSQSELSLEYTVLGLGGLDYQPEPWTPVDSLAWLKAMTAKLDSSVQEEIDRARLSVSRSPEQVAELYPRSASGPARADAWAVSGRHTVSGKPLLATDPELETSVPGEWQQVGLHCRTVGEDCPFDVSGLSLPGVPGVLVGHNRDIAWGLSATGADVSDLYLESVSGRSYTYDGKVLPLLERDEVIRVRGESSRTFTVRATRHGPLLSDVSGELSSVGANAEAPAGSPDRGNGYAVALATTALEPRPSAEAIFALDRAAGWTEFGDAAAQLSLPGQQLVYADVAGNIGAQTLGPLPVRAGARNGSYPAVGWLPANDWEQTSQATEQLSRAYNPGDGVVGADARVAQLVGERLESGSLVDVGDVATMQHDSRSEAARLLMPYLSRQLMTSEYYADGQRLLAGWDLQQPAGSAAAAYFNVVWSNLLRLTFHDQLPQSLWPDGGRRWVAVVANLLRRPEDPWWDDADTEGVIEDRDTVLAQAMRDARDELTRRLGVSTRSWSWGRLHRLELRSPVSGAGAGALFDRGPYDAPGGNGAVDGSAWDAAQGYAVTTAPVARLVVDLDDADRSRWVSLAGTSGHVWSGHYRDQVPPWLDGTTLAWPATRPAVERATEHRLVLEPAD